MDSVNQKIIDAVIAKAEKVCPDSLALIGIYGSVATGDAYEKSDLDLLILIENDEGWQLGTGFILDDSNIGYDIYCTNWDGLKYDAECHHAQISKLMDSKIVYVKKQEALDELHRLREQAKAFLKSEDRFERVNELIEKAKVQYANAYLHDELGQVRLDSFGVIYYLLDAMMFYHGTYFKRGVKRIFEELEKLPIEEVFSDMIKSVAGSKDVTELRELSKGVLLYVENYTRREEEKREPSQELTGTYEEMYSNWRNKVAEAAEQDNAVASFMNLCNFHYMIAEIGDEVEIGNFNIMEVYNPDCLQDNVELFDMCLQKYEDVYKSAGIEVKRFSNVDVFVADYLCE